MHYLLSTILWLASVFPAVGQNDDVNGGEKQMSPTKLIAFPGAEGYGKYTKGGRGGAVYEVTNLNDNGPGSLRAAIEAEGPRTVVFRLSGNIVLEDELVISEPYITIAGQTAPGDGICISRFPLMIGADHVIIRHLRLRLGNEGGDAVDALSGRYHKNIIVDHVSASWAIDETVSIYYCDSTTVQWCIISESLHNSIHPKGPHGFGGIWGGNYCTYHHNLLAHHTSRNPRFGSGSPYTDFRNNVIYNWGYNSAYGGEAHYRDDAKWSSTYVNMVANYFKPGPATQPGEVSHRIVNPSTRDGANDFGRWFVDRNVVEGSPDVTSDNWHGGVQINEDDKYLQGIKADEEFPGTMPLDQHTAAEAFEHVLRHAGATIPLRDPVDTRICSEVREGSATFEGKSYRTNHDVSDPDNVCGIIDSQSDVGGWPEYRSADAPVDSDRDGMPDTWEDTNGLDKNDSSDRNTISDNGYTMLEVYLNSIVQN